MQGFTPKTPAAGTTSPVPSGSAFAGGGYQLGLRLGPLRVPGSASVVLCGLIGVRILQLKSRVLRQTRSWRRCRRQQRQRYNAPYSRHSQKMELPILPVK